jgi:hypothetical protein
MRFVRSRAVPPSALPVRGRPRLPAAARDRCTNPAYALLSFESTPLDVLTDRTARGTLQTLRNVGRIFEEPTSSKSIHVKKREPLVIKAHYSSRF